MKKGFRFLCICVLIIFQLGFININVYPQSFKIKIKNEKVVVLNNVYMYYNRTGKPKYNRVSLNHGTIEIPLSSIKYCLFDWHNLPFSAKVVLKSGKIYEGSNDDDNLYLSGFDADGVRLSFLMYYNVEYIVASGYSVEIVEKSLTKSPNKTTHLTNKNKRIDVHGIICLHTIIDSRDGQEYPTVRIGNQCWLRKNMNYKIGNSCCYGNSSSNCATYGRLYDWETALKVCPKGWHLPSDAEWTILTDNLGGESVANSSLKETGISHWRSASLYYIKGATNKSGFTALPGGKRNPDGSFSYLTDNAYFWSSSLSGQSLPWSRGLNYYYERVDRGHALKSFGFSVRCVKD